MSVGAVGEVVADECDKKCVFVLDTEGNSVAACGTVEHGEKGAYMCIPVNTEEDNECILDYGPCDNGNDFGYPIA